MGLSIVGGRRALSLDGSKANHGISKNSPACETIMNVMSRMWTLCMIKNPKITIKNRGPSFHYQKSLEAE